MKLLKNSFFFIGFRSRLFDGFVIDFICLTRRKTLLPFALWQEEDENIIQVWFGLFGLVLWRIDYCRLVIAKSILMHVNYSLSNNSVLYKNSFFLTHS